MVTQVPHFDVVDVAGRQVHYGDIWQHRNLLLVLVDDDRTAAPLAAAAAQIAAHDTVAVITTSPVADVPRPGVLIADRWGEVQVVHAGAPDVDDILAWLEYVQQRCPECEGEAR